jgi:hypothetical protein
MILGASLSNDGMVARALLHLQEELRWNASERRWQ